MNVAGLSIFFAGMALRDLLRACFVIDSCPSIRLWPTTAAPGLLAERDVR